MFKNKGKFQGVGGEFGGGRGGNFEEKKRKTLKCHPKINLCTKLHPNRIMGKGSKIGGKLGNVTNQLTDVEKPH